MEAIDTIKGYAFLARQELRSLLRFTSGQKKEKRLLLLAPFLPPYDNGGVHRPLSWIQYAQESGWTVSVLTRPFTGAPSPLGLYLQTGLPNIEIGYVSELDITPSWSYFPRTDGSFLAALGSISVGAQILNRGGFSAIAATGPSFDLFVTAFYLSRMFALPLMLDYRDEWTENPHRMVTVGNADRFWEKRCLQAASIVTFTTKAMLEHHQGIFPVLRRKGAVLRNGWEPADRTQTPSPAPKSKRMRLLFAGTMGDATLPGDFLRALSVVLTENPEWRERIEVYVVGTRVPKAAEQLASFPFPDVLTIDGNRPKDEVAALIEDSDVMLLFTPPAMDRYIPGKLYDYIGSGNAVLVYGHAGEAAQIVVTLGAGRVASDPLTLLRALDQFRSDPLKWNSADRQRWAQMHTRRQLSRQFFAMADECSS